MNKSQIKFPFKEVVKDFAGQERSFTINLYEPEIGGYLLVAKEDIEKNNNGGYQFEDQ